MIKNLNIYNKLKIKTLIDVLNHYFCPNLLIVTPISQNSFFENVFKKYNSNPSAENEYLMTYLLISVENISKN